MKQIVISLIDRLAGFAAREAENESPDERKAQEEELSRRLAETIKASRDNRLNTEDTRKDRLAEDPSDGVVAAIVSRADKAGEGGGEEAATLQPRSKVGHGESSVHTDCNRKFRGIPSDVPLFEIFWQQVVQLISVSSSSLAKSPASDDPLLL